MRRCNRWLAGLLLTFSTLLSAAPQTVVVMTSYPEEVMTRIEDGFAQAHPQYRLQILWRQGFDALPYLLQARQGGVDVYWAPSPGNFARLAKAGSWQPLGVNLKGLPAQIGGLALRDPQHLYQATELAGYGFAINATALGQLGVPSPRDWPDLLAPACADALRFQTLAGSALRRYCWISCCVPMAGSAAGPSGASWPARRAW